jgi:undecaprenyl-diphosphatase
VPWLLGWSDPGLAFDTALHLGTLLAVLAYFWRDWLNLAKAFFASVAERRIGTDGNRLMAWLLIIGTIPGAVAGFLLEHTVDAVFHTPNSGHVAWALLVMAVVIAALAGLLALGEKLASHSRAMGDLRLRDTIIIGLAQAAALVPGVSRSGATITAGLLLGLQREAAARFSFLLACPIVAGAGLKKVHDLLKQGLPHADKLAFAVGLLVAAVSGYICIAFLLRYLQRKTLMPFVYYRVGLAVVILVVVLAG